MNTVISPKSGASRDTVTVSPNAIAKNRNALAEFVRFVNKVIFLSDEETQIGMLRAAQLRLQRLVRARRLHHLADSRDNQIGSLELNIVAAVFGDDQPPICGAFDQSGMRRLACRVLVRWPNHQPALDHDQRSIRAEWFGGHNLREAGLHRRAFRIHRTRNRRLETKRFDGPLDVWRQPFEWHTGFPWSEIEQPCQSKRVDELKHAQYSSGRQCVLAFFDREPGKVASRRWIKQHQTRDLVRELACIHLDVQGTDRVTHEDIWARDTRVVKQRMEFCGDLLAGAGGRSTLAPAKSGAIVDTHLGRLRNIGLYEAPVERCTAQPTFGHNRGATGWACTTAVDVQLIAAHVYQLARGGVGPLVARRGGRLVDRADHGQAGDQC